MSQRHILYANKSTSGVTRFLLLTLITITYSKTNHMLMTVDRAFTVCPAKETNENG